MVDALLTVFWGLLLLIIIVVVHELGHFIAARAFGVRVTEFMIGMPGPNIGFERNGTRYGITCIPLGGYNRIAGMEGGKEDPNLAPVLAYVYRQGSVDVEHVAQACNLEADDAEYVLTVLDGWGAINKPGRSNKTDKWCAPKTDGLELGQAREVQDPVALLDSHRKETYRGLPCWKRLIVLFAGPFANAVLTVVLILVAFCGIGMQYSTTTIDSLLDGSPAQEAGLQPGDTITSVDGTQVEYLSQLNTALADKQAGDTVTLGISRDGQDITVKLKAAQNDNGKAIIGIYATTDRMRLGPGEALQSAWSMMSQTVVAYAMLFNPSTSAQTLSQSSSIVGISVLAKQAAGIDVFMYLYIVAAVSISIGIVNLVPVPPLDGGKIVTECVEKVIRRPVSVRVINATTIVFIALMLIFFIYMVRQDIFNFIL